MALHILDRAYADGSLRPGDVIAEASSGNTGIAFSAIGSALGHPVVIFMPDFMSEERKALIRAYGAEIFEISRLQGGFVGSIRMAEDSKKDQEMRGNRVFLPRQFRNDINAEAHYLTTGPEILLQLAQKGLRPAAFVAGVGTGGTIMGVARCMKENCSGAGGKGDVRLHPVEPAESPTLSTGSHQVCKPLEEVIYFQHLLPCPMIFPLPLPLPLTLTLPLPLTLTLLLPFPSTFSLPLFF